MLSTRAAIGQRWRSREVVAGDRARQLLGRRARDRGSPTSSAPQARQRSASPDWHDLPNSGSSLDLGVGDAKRTAARSSGEISLGLSERPLTRRICPILRNYVANTP